jgi:hypothetical protein
MKDETSLKEGLEDGVGGLSLHLVLNVGEAMRVRYEPQFSVVHRSVGSRQQCVHQCLLTELATNVHESLIMCVTVRSMRGTTRLRRVSIW